MKNRTPSKRSDRIAIGHIYLRSQSGLTLLETLAALVILSVGIAGVLQAFSGSMNATKESQLYSQAAMLADQVAGQLEKEQNLDSGEYSGASDDAPGFAWQAEVEPADSEGLMRTTIDVTWGTQARPRTFTMVAYLHPEESQTSEQSK